MAGSEDPNYPASFYARLFNVTERRVQMLAKEGVIPKAARGKYPLIGTIRGYVAFLQERRLSAGADGENDYKTHKVRLTKAQADGQELKNRIAEQEVLPIEFVRFFCSEIAVRTGGFVDTFPLDCARELALNASDTEKLKRKCAEHGNDISGLADPGTIRGLIDEYFDQAMG